MPNASGWKLSLVQSAADRNEFIVGYCRLDGSLLTPLLSVITCWRPVPRREPTGLHTQVTIIVMPEHQLEMLKQEVNIIHLGPKRFSGVFFEVFHFGGHELRKKKCRGSASNMSGSKK